ncbi:MAG: acylphosphatase [Proteobacteria bacterium]|nr:acylphosphatase [Pseudomonadota bacterium]MBU1450043.1 acylphosphatase [Pseudomonadota bacterium]MBU2467239.1 acylphosphatase [Pseudomonadota bacterium]MBU2519059.1 acylphosphatase [Pseudomonadota bacterium]
MEQVRAVALIKGKVQGVWFRASTQREAQALGLDGYVRNLPLRRVEAVFQGPRPLVERALAWCRQGPPAAEVREVSVSWLEPDPALKGFEVRY